MPLSAMFVFSQYSSTIFLHSVQGTNSTLKGDHADEIWIVNTEKMTKKLLVPPHFTCSDVTKLVIDPHHLRFSPDSNTLYFETSAWVTSGAIHAVNVDGKHERFVTDGTELRIVQTGSYKGDLIVN